MHRYPFGFAWKKFLSFIVFNSYAFIFVSISNCA